MGDVCGVQQRAQALERSARIVERATVTERHRGGRVAEQRRKRALDALDGTHHKFGGARTTSITDGVERGDRRRAPQPTGRPRSLRIVGAIAVGLATLGLAGCGGGSNNASSPPTTGASTTGKPTAAATAGQPGSVTTTNAKGEGTPIDVCATISAGKAAQLAGLAITTAGPRSGLQDQEYGCAYSNDDSSIQVQVTVFEHDGATGYSTAYGGNNNVTAVSGLGDKAFYDNDGTLYALAGKNLIQVNGVNSADNCAALARPLLAVL